MSRRAGRRPEENFNPRFLDEDALLAFPEGAEQHVEVGGRVLACNDEAADWVARY